MDSDLRKVRVGSRTSVQICIVATRLSAEFDPVCRSSINISYWKPHDFPVIVPVPRRAYLSQVGPICEPCLSCPAGSVSLPGSSSIANCSCKVNIYNIK